MRENLKPAMSSVGAIAVLALATGLVVAAPAGRALPDRYVPSSLDGEPVQATVPSGDQTWSAWAYRQGAEYDLALSVRDASGVWSDPWFFGASDGLDQVDPSLLFDDAGSGYLVYAVRETGAIHLVYRVGGTSSWQGPFAISPDGVRASAPVVRQVGGRIVVAFRTPDGVDLVDFRQIPAVPRIIEHGIQEGPDVVDPLGREIDTGSVGDGEMAMPGDDDREYRPGGQDDRGVRRVRPIPTDREDSL